jgi:hypothetical protein
MPYASAATDTAVNPRLLRIMRTDCRISAQRNSMVPVTQPVLSEFPFYCLTVSLAEGANVIRDSASN